MEPPIFNTYMDFSRHHFCCFTVAPLFVLDKSTAWSRCLQHPCFKHLCKISQASKNSDFNAQHFLSDWLTHSWFHSMLFALPGYQFPYIVMNRCFYLNRILRYRIHNVSGNWFLRFHKFDVQWWDLNSVDEKWQHCPCLLLWWCEWDLFQEWSLVHANI
jgi:hypothetical protein